MSSDRDPVEPAPVVGSVTQPTTVPGAPAAEANAKDDDGPSSETAGNLHPGSSENGSAVAAGRSGRTPNHVLDSVALMVINGASYEDISASTGIKVDTLQGWVTDGKNQHFTKALAVYRDKLLRHTSHHQMKLLDMFDHAYRAVNQALISDDEGLAARTAWEVFDRALPQKPEADLQLNIGVGNVHFDTQVRNTFAAVGEKFGGLMDRLAKDDPDRYIRSESEVYEIPVEHETIDVAPTLDLNNDSESS